MSLKLCFASEIHRVSKLPANYNALVQTIQIIFGSRLPSNWAIQYLDSDGDKIMLAREEDFQSVIAELDSPSKSAKLFIVERGNLNDSKFSSADLLEVIHQEEKILPQDPVKEDFLASIPRTKSIEVPKTNGDKPEQLPEPQVALVDQQLQKADDAQGEKAPATGAQENKEENKERKGKFNHFKMKAKHLTKKLLDRDLSPEERQQLEEKLATVTEKLNPEELSWLDAKANEMKEKARKKSEKRRKTLKETVTGLIRESVGQLLTAKPEKEKDRCPKKLYDEFIVNFAALPEDKKKEFNDLMNGVPEKIVAAHKARAELKEQKRLERSKSAKNIEKLEKLRQKREEILLRKQMKEKEREEKKEKSPKREKRSKSPKPEKIKKEKKPEEQAELKIELQPIDKIEEKPAVPEKKKERSISPAIQMKVNAVKDIFPDAEVQELVDFIKKNRKLTLDDLVENFLALKH